MSRGLRASEPKIRLKTTSVLGSAKTGSTGRGGYGRRRRGANGQAAQLGPSKISVTAAEVLARSSQRSSRSGSFSARMRSRAASGTATPRTRSTVSTSRARALGRAPARRTSSRNRSGIRSPSSSPPAPCGPPRSGSLAPSRHRIWPVHRRAPGPQAAPPPRSPLPVRSSPCAMAESTASSGRRAASAGSVMTGTARRPSTGGVSTKPGMPVSIGAQHQAATSCSGATTSRPAGQRYLRARAHQVLGPGEALVVVDGELDLDDDDRDRGRRRRGGGRRHRRGTRPGGSG